MQDLQQAADSHPMTILKANLRNILNYFDNSKRVLFFDYPLHTNVGDLLINLGTEEFFRDSHINVWKRYSCFDLPRVIPNMDPDVVILCQGGGNFGDIYPYYQKGREALLERFPHNRIVVLPQTVYFKEQKAAKESIKRFKTHGNVHIFLRDEKSICTVQEGGLTTASLMPDMAHYLWGTITRPDKSASRDTLRFIRRDAEAKPLLGSVPGDAMPSYDWWTLLPGFQLSAAKYLLRFISLQNHLGFPWQKHHLWYPMRDILISEAIKRFADYRRLETNRLHAMILGTLLKMPVSAGDNSYGKLSSYYKAWLANHPDVSMTITD